MSQGRGNEFSAMIDTFASLDDVIHLNPLGPPAGPSGFVPVPPILPLPPQEPATVPASTQQETKNGSRKRANDKRGAGKLQVKDQISELEQQLQAKMNEALELERCNQKLRLRSRMLELVIGSRDRQVHTLRQLRQATLASQAQVASRTNSTTSPSPLPSPHDSSAPQQLAQTGTPHAAGALVNPFSTQPPPNVRVMAAMPDAPTGPLDPPNWTTLKMYASMSLEKHMEVYTELVEILSAEMVKPGLGRTREMMYNLSEFTRIIALMTDQLALLVTRDVRGVQEAALNAAAKAALPSSNRPALPSNSGGPQAGGPGGYPPGGLFGEINRLLDQSSSGKVNLHKSNSSQSINEGSQSSLSSAQEERSGVRHMSSSGFQDSNLKRGGSEAEGTSAQQQQQHPDQQLQPQSQQQQQQQQEAYERFRESLSGRVGVALAKASSDLIDAHAPVSAWLVPPARSPSLPEERLRPWNQPMSVADTRLRTPLANASTPSTADPAALRAVWQSVARVLDLSEQQRADAAMLLELHAGWMRRVGEQRTWLSKELSNLLASKQYHKTGVQSGETAYPLQEPRIMDALEKNLRAEHAILMLVGEVFAFQLLTMEQSARVLIHSWPHISDYVAIMQCAVEQHAQAQQQLLPMQPKPMLPQRQ